MRIRTRILGKGGLGARGKRQLWFSDQWKKKPVLQNYAGRPVCSVILLGHHFTLPPIFFDSTSMVLTVAIEADQARPFIGGVGAAYRCGCAIAK